MIFAVALFLRLLSCFVVYPYVAADFGAGDHYDEIARNLAQGRGYTLAHGNAAGERLPLYPLILAGFMALFGAADWPWRVAQSLAGALTCALVYTAARRFASRRGALIAAGVCAVHPALILYAARPLTETLYVLLVVVFVRRLMRADWGAAPVGFLLGLQLLTKSTAFLHLFALVSDVRPRAARLAQALVCTGVVLAPWAIWNLATAGVTNLTSATGGIALYHGVFISRHVGWATPATDTNLDAELALRRDLAARGVAADADVRRRDAAAGDLAMAWIRAHPGEALRLWLRNLLLTWYLGRSRLSMGVYAILHGVLLMAAAVGARALWSGDPAARRVVIVTGMMIVAYTLFHAAVQPAVRYILPAVPCVALLAARGWGPPP